MVKLPNLPPQEEIQYKEKEFFLSLYEQFQQSSKIWFVFLAAAVVAAIPLKSFIAGKFAASLISSYRPVEVNENPYHPEDLRVLKAKAIPAGQNLYSAYAQILNPNPEVSAREFQYRLMIKNSGGQIIKTIPAVNFILAGESKFLLFPTITLNEKPDQVEIEFQKIRWTGSKPAFDTRLEILQKNTGVTAENQFFVEGLLRNLESFGIKQVELGAIVFDKSNQNILAVNISLLTDITPLENRYFRLIWPSRHINTSTVGQVTVIPQVNPLNPGLILENGEKLPAR